MVAPRVEKAYEKYAWLAFVVFGIAVIVSAVVLTLTGSLPSQNLYQSDITLGKSWSTLQASNPDVVKLSSDLIRLYAELLFPVGVFTVAISFKSFRRGEKWSWYAFCILPLTLIYEVGLEASFGTPFGAIASFDLPFAALCLVGLLLPYRKFFPKKP
jgi:hypothetical protein